MSTKRSTTKEELAAKAKKHANDMVFMFEPEIKRSTEKTDIITTSLEIKKEKVEKVNFICLKTDTVSALFKYKAEINRDNYKFSKKCCILNFASFTQPGGNFIGGSMAQEEALCSESILYNVLRNFKFAFYNANLNHKNNCMYENRMLYSPDILFSRFYDNKENIITTDVITCAAPNKSAAQRNYKVTNGENTKFLKSRIAFVLNVAAAKNADTLILGAYGCGVFGQDPYEVARIFRSYLTGEYKYFSKVIFAVPDWKYEIFNKILG